MTYLGLWDTGQLSKVVAELHVLELEGVVPVVLKRSHDLVTHPLHLKHAMLDVQLNMIL